MDTLSIAQRLKFMLRNNIRDLSISLLKSFQFIINARRNFYLSFNLNVSLLAIP